MTYVAYIWLITYHAQKTKWGMHIQVPNLETNLETQRSEMTRRVVGSSSQRETTSGRHGRVIISPLEHHG